MARPRLHVPLTADALALLGGEAIARPWAVDSAIAPPAQLEEAVVCGPEYVCAEGTPDTDIVYVISQSGAPDYDAMNKAEAEAVNAPGRVAPLGFRRPVPSRGTPSDYGPHVWRSVDGVAACRRLSEWDRLHPDATSQSRRAALGVFGGRVAGQIRALDLPIPEAGL